MYLKYVLKRFHTHSIQRERGRKEKQQNVRACMGM